MIYRHEFTQTIQTSAFGGSVSWNTVSQPGAAVGTLTYAGSGSVTSNSLSSQLGSIYALGASVPSGSTITGIELHLWASADSGNVGTAHDVLARITKNGVALQNRSTGAVLSSTPQHFVFGGPNDLWGTTWVPSDVAGIDWHYQIALVGGSGIYHVDDLEIWVHTADTVTTIPVCSQISSWIDSGVVVHPGEALQIATAGAVTWHPQSMNPLSPFLNEPTAASHLPGDPYFFWALPEGAYPPDYPQVHALDPAAVVQLSNLTSAQVAALAATNDVPFSVVACLRYDDPYWAPPPRGISNGLQPNRDTTFTAQNLVDASSGQRGPWRVWLIFNDFDNSDNSGCFDTTLTLFKPGAFDDMGDRFSILNKTQFGKETTMGTVVAATKEIQSFVVNPSIKTTVKQHRTEGYKRGDLAIVNKEWSEAAIDGIATYTELPILLASLVSAPTSALYVAGVYDHVFVSDCDGPDALWSYTVEHGTPASCERFAYGMVSGLSFKSTRDDISMSGTMYGRAMQDSVNDSISMTSGGSAVQTVTVTAATGGTFTLSFLGEVTTPILYNAPTNTGVTSVQNALQALSTIGAGNATVGGSVGAYTITFAGALAAQPVAPLIADGTALTGTSPTVVVAQTTAGGMTRLPKIPILPGDFSFYLGDQWSDLGLPAKKVLRQFETDWGITDRHKPFWVQDSAQGSFAAHAEGEPKESIEIILGVDAARPLQAAHRAGTRKFIRLDYSSKAFTVATGVPYAMQCDFCVEVDAVKEFKDEEGIYALGFTLGIKRDPISNVAYRITVRNGVTSY